MDPTAALSLETPRRARFYSLDALRGIAVFLMIEQHVGIWLFNGSRADVGAWYPALIGFNALGGGAAPLFVSLAGMGSALYCHAKGDEIADRILVRRGLVLMLFGFLLNVVTPRWFSWGSWFVLHTMGFAMALAPLWRRVSTRALVGATVLVLAATPFIQTWLDTPLQLTNPRMADLDLPGGPLRLAVAEGQFPIFPWLAFYLAGFASGRWIADGRGRNVALLGASIMAASALGHLAWRLGAFAFAPKLLVWRAFGLQLTFFPATVAIAGLLLGGALLFIAGAFWLEERRPLRADHPLVTLGRGSLTLLMLHVPLFRELTRPIDFQLGGMHIAFDLGLWRALSAPATLTVVLCLVALATWATWVWQRHGYRYGAEWALRRLAG